MKRLLSGFAVICAIVVLVPCANADIFTFNATLDGLQEVPFTASTGTGFAVLTLDDVAQTLLVNLTYSGLVSPVTNPLIHAPAPPGQNAAVMLSFIPYGFVTGATSGSFVSSPPISLTPTQMTEIESGLAYINLHTTQFPAGEIRGQIIPQVPEPATMLLIGSGLIGLAGLRKRFRE